MSEDPYVIIARALREHRPPERPRGLSLLRRARRQLHRRHRLPAGRAGPTGSPPGCARATRRFVYRNLAVEGATSAEVLEQLRPGARARARPGDRGLRRQRRPPLHPPRPSGYARRLADLRRPARRRPAVHVVTATAPERWDFLELGPRTRARVEARHARRQRRDPGSPPSTACPASRSPAIPGSATARTSPPTACTPRRGHARAARGFAALLRDGYGIPIAIKEGDEP